MKPRLVPRPCVMPLVRLFALVAALVTLEAAPSFSRSGPIGGSNDERVTAVATDPQGNVNYATYLGGSGA